MDRACGDRHRGQARVSRAGRRRPLEGEIASVYSLPILAVVWNRFQCYCPRSSARARVADVAPVVQGVRAAVVPLNQPGRGETMRLNFLRLLVVFSAAL